MTLWDNFSERDKTQLMAALVFWRQILDHAQTPPHAHPSVAPVFGSTVPMDVDEMDGLIERLKSNGKVSVERVARVFSIPTEGIRERMIRAGYQPDEQGRFDWIHCVHCLGESDE